MKRAFGIAAVALLAAGASYLALRDGLRLHEWARAAGGDRVHDAARGADVPGWVRFTLPDALWQFALCVIVFAIWRGAPWSRAKIAWCVGASSFGVVIEIAQRARLIEGTFDVADVIGSIAAALAALLLECAWSQRSARSHASIDASFSGSSATSTRIRSVTPPR